MASNAVLGERKDEIYSLLQWNLTPDQITEKTDNAIASFIKDIETIENISLDNRTFKNTVLAMDDASRKVSSILGPVTFLSNCSTNLDVRNAALESQQKYSKISIDIYMRSASYKALKQWQNKNEAVDELEQKLFDKFLKTFVRNGLDLTPDKQEDLSELRKRISELEIEFRHNLNEVDDKIVFKSEELEGVPENVLDGFNKNDKGDYHLGTTYPEVFPVFEYAKNPETRKKMQLLFSNRCAEINTPLMQEAVIKRDEAAKLLGYANHPEYVHEIRMVGKPEVVNDLQYTLVDQLKSHVEDEIQLLLDIKKEEYPDVTELEPYDTSYYSRIYKERKFNLDQNKLKEYFPTDYVVEQMMKFYEEIFDIKFYPLNDAPTWHEDAKPFAMKDGSSGKLFGIFYLDLFPREGKFNHAAVFPSINNKDIRVAGMLCNFNKPTADLPSLLTHSQANTLFHEFGHIVDFMVSTSKYTWLQSLKWDFIEAPSQMLENWLYEKEVLSLVSKHYKTGEPIPDNDIEMMKISRSALKPTMYMRQLALGIFDMKLHSEGTNNVNKLMRDTFTDLTMIKQLEESNPVASFGHLMGGYHAGYYGYLWARVISSDLFTRFTEEGMTSKKVGMDYRKWILEPGEQMDHFEAVEKYLGRKYNNKAFMKLIGLEN